MKFIPLTVSSVSTLLAMALTVPPAFAKDLPYSDSYQAQISSQFYDGTQLSKAKTDAYIARLDKKESQINKIVKNQPGQNAGDDDGSKLGKDLKVAIQNLQAAEVAKTRLEQFNLIQSALDIESSIRVDGQGTPLVNAFGEGKHLITNHKIPKASKAIDEASNLYDPTTSSYLSVDQINSLKKQGADLSAYGPGPNSVFWKSLDVTRGNINDALEGRNLGIYGAKELFPKDTSVLYYKEVRHTQTVPKIDVYALENGKKIKYKFKMGAEMNAGPMAATFMMALGFPGEVSTYLHHNVRLELGKNTIDDMKREWEVYYMRDGMKPYIIEDYIVGQGTDAQGNYVIFKDGALEAKPKSVERVGGWAFADNDHDNFREVRGAAFLQMFIDNSDMKEFGNNRLILTKADDGSIERHLMISDVGHSFGWLFLETPDLYKWNMVTKSSGSTIDFNYRSVQPVSVLNKITFQDARWATRLIARLTRAQFAAISASGGWPDCVQKSYTERMISRRNDLVTQFGLGNEFPLMTLAGSQDAYAYKAICAADTKAAAQTYSTPYDGTLSTLLFDPMKSTVWNAIVGGVQSAIAGQQRIVLSSANFKLDPRMISAIIITPSRQIERNPHPTSENDIQIVEDTIEIGLRLGVAFGAYTDVIYTRKYSLAYPARNVTDAALNNGFIVNALLPMDVHKNKLPDSYVLKTEHYLENGAGVEADYKASPVSPVIKAGGAHINLWRSIYDHRDLNHQILYRDHSVANGFKLDTSLRTLFVDWPVFSELDSWGHAAGKGLVFSQADLVASDTMNHAVLHAVVAGDFSGLHAQEKQFDTADQFQETLKKWNFLFWSGGSDKRLDTFAVTANGATTTSVQYRAEKNSNFNFLTNKETKSAQVEVYTSPSTPNVFDMKVSIMASDVATSDQEMQRYLNFVNGLSIDGKKIIPFDPKLGYTVKGKWGATVTRSDNQYSSAAITALLSLAPSAVWQAVATSIDEPVSQLRVDFANYRRFQAAGSGPRSGTPNLATYNLDNDRVLLLTATTQIIKALQNAQSRPSLEKKVKNLAEAFRAAIYVDSTGFYTPVLLRALNQVVGLSGILSQNIITVPQFTEQAMINDSPLYGAMGNSAASGNKYMLFMPLTPIDLYTIFDNWF